MLFSPSNFFKATFKFTVNPFVVFAGAASSACGACAVSVLCAGWEVFKSHRHVSRSII
jgi:hypothetical protein